MKNDDLTNIFDYIKIPRDKIINCEITESYNSIPTISIEAAYEPSILVKEDNNITINAKELSTCITTGDRLCALENELNKKMKEWKGDNMEKIDNILDRYERYQIKEIDRQCDEDIKFIRDTSDLAKIYDKLKKQAEKELTKLYPDRNYEEIEHYIYISYDNDDKCQKDIGERITYRNEKIEEIKQKIEDVKVLISIAETFEQKMEILRNYEIIDEKGRIYE